MVVVAADAVVVVLFVWVVVDVVVAAAVVVVVSVLIVVLAVFVLLVAVVVVVVLVSQAAQGRFARFLALPADSIFLWSRYFYHCSWKRSYGVRTWLAIVRLSQRMLLPTVDWTVRCPMREVQIPRGCCSRTEERCFAVDSEPSASQG